MWQNTPRNMYEEGPVYQPDKYIIKKTGCQCTLYWRLVLFCSVHIVNLLAGGGGEVWPDGTGGLAEEVQLGREGQPALDT